MEKYFIRFLKDHRAYSAYTRNVKAMWNISVKAFLKEYKDIPIAYLYSCFIWGRTKEGVQFWADLATAWSEHLGEEIEDEE